MSISPNQENALNRKAQSKMNVIQWRYVRREFVIATKRNKVLWLLVAADITVGACLFDKLCNKMSPVR